MNAFETKKGVIALCLTSTRYRRCRCPIHVYGTPGGETIRRALDQTSWEAAPDLINGWTTPGEIGVVKAEAPTIREAIAKLLTDCEARHLGWEAMRKYGTSWRTGFWAGATPRACQTSGS